MHAQAQHVYLPSNGSVSGLESTEGNQYEFASDEREIYLGKGNTMQELKGK
jgi:hypothetical protein